MILYAREINWICVAAMQDTNGDEVGYGRVSYCRSLTAKSADSILSVCISSMRVQLQVSICSKAEGVSTPTPHTPLSVAFSYIQRLCSRGCSCCQPDSLLQVCSTAFSGCNHLRCYHPVALRSRFLPATATVCCF